MNIKKLSLGEENVWDTYVINHPESSFFHLSGWKSVIERSMGYEGTYLIATDNTRIIGVYPFFVMKTGLFGNMGVSIPYLDYGGILSDNAEAEMQLLNAAEVIGRDARCRYIELRQQTPLKSNLPAAHHKVRSVLSLDGDAETVFQRMKKTVRAKIRKAEKSGVIVQEGIGHLTEFYQIYSRNLRDLGTPVLTRHFFEYMAERFHEQIRIYRAVRMGKTIGVKASLVNNNTSYFVWAATIRESLSYAPAHAMHWAAIQDACKAGCTYVDWGRNTAGSSHHSFKESWGTNTLPLTLSYQLIGHDGIPGLNKENPKFSLAIALWKRMPLFLSRIIGPPLARRLP